MALMLIGVAIYYTESMLRQGFTVRGVFIVLLAVSLAIHTLYVSITWFVSGEYHDYTGEKSKQCDNCSLYYKNAWSYQFLRLNIPLLRVTWFGGGDSASMEKVRFRKMGFVSFQSSHLKCLRKSGMLCFPRE